MVKKVKGNWKGCRSTEAQSSLGKQPSVCNPRTRKKRSNETTWESVGVDLVWCSVYPSGHGTGIADTLTQVLVRRVISEPPELVLDGFGERGIGNDRVLRFLVCEVRVKIGYIQNRFLELRRCRSRQIRMIGGKRHVRHSV